MDAMSESFNLQQRLQACQTTSKLSVGYVSAASSAHTKLLCLMA
jgi:hypothetical protein